MVMSTFTSFDGRAGHSHSGLAAAFVARIAPPRRPSCRTRNSRSGGRVYSESASTIGPGESAWLIDNPQASSRTPGSGDFIPGSTQRCSKSSLQERPATNCRRPSARRSRAGRSIMMWGFHDHRSIRRKRTSLDGHLPFETARSGRRCPRRHASVADVSKCQAHTGRRRGLIARQTPWLAQVG